MAISRLQPRWLNVSCLVAVLFGGPAVAPAHGASETGRVVETVVTEHDPGQQYALYLPSGYLAERAEERTWPVLFVLDPRGRAVPGIERRRI